MVFTRQKCLVCDGVNLTNFVQLSSFRERLIEVRFQIYVYIPSADIEQSKKHTFRHLFSRLLRYYVLGSLRNTLA